MLFLELMRCCNTVNSKRRQTPKTSYVLFVRLVLLETAIGLGGGLGGLVGGYWAKSGGDYFVPIMSTAGIALGSVFLLPLLPSSKYRSNNSKDALEDPDQQISPDEGMLIHFSISYVVVYIILQ